MNIFKFIIFSEFVISTKSKFYIKDRPKTRVKTEETNCTKLKKQINKNQD
jgi:hypothetical protein